MDESASSLFIVVIVVSVLVSIVASVRIRRTKGKVDPLTDDAALARLAKQKQEQGK